jgi:hypothetical protein
MNTRIALTFAVVALTASAVAHADGEHKPKYGGVVAVVKDVQYELVAKPDSVALFVEDHGRKLGTVGATGKLTLLNGAEKTEIALVSAGDNKLEARGSFKVQAGTKAVAVVTLAGKPAVSARFEIR